MKYYFLILITLLFFNVEKANACTNDFQCGYGNRCVKPSGSYSFEGTCVKVVDQFGNKDYDASSNWGSTSPKEVSGCQWNTDCSFGFKCLKEAGQMRGFCAK